MPRSLRLPVSVLNTVLVLVVAGVLFWLQPGVLSSPVDGVFVYVNTEKIVEWQRPGELVGGYFPHEGMGSRLLQIVPALLPQTYAFRLTSDPTLRVWLSYMIQTGLLAASALAYYRAAGVPLGLAVAATWLCFVLALTMSDLARSSWNAVWAQAGMLVALVLFIQIGRGRRSRNAIWLVGFVLFSLVLLLSDHVTVGYLVGPPSALAFIAHLLATPCWRERLWKLGALATAGVTVLVLGIPQWAQALTASVARTVFYDELIAQPQHAINAGMIFRALDGYAIVYALVVVGVLGELAVGDRRRRALAAFTAVVSVGLAAAGLVWLLTDLKWFGPAPAYFNVFIFPWLALSAVRGIDHAMSWRPDLSGRLVASRLAWMVAALVAVAALLGARLYVGTASTTTVRLVAVVFGAAQVARLPRVPCRVAALVAFPVAIGLVLFNGGLIRYDRWRNADPHSVQRLFATPALFGEELSAQVSVTPGDRFRGYADVLVSEKGATMTAPNELRAWHVLDIPTLSQYSHFLTPAYHAFFSRLLDAPDDNPNVNHAAISRINLPLMRMLGLRYLMVKGPIEMPGLTRVARQGEYRLYQLSDPNLASFSPTRPHQAPDARGLLDTLANPGFDPRTDVAIAEELGIAGDLVPATDTTLTFVRGGFRFTGKSAGRSLVVLPVQYTRCLDLRTVSGAGDGARALRVNLIQTGVLFSGDAEIEGRYRLGGPWEGCIRDDVADIDRLRFRDLVERRRVPGYSFPGERFKLFAPFGLD